MKIQELKGALLDYWVAKAEEKEIFATDGTYYIARGRHADKYSPSSDWSQGGPIIEREKLVLMPWVQTNREEWASRRKDDWHKQGDPYFGPTPLTAAMRCFVASKFGEEVPDAPTTKED